MRSRLQPVGGPLVTRLLLGAGAAAVVGLPFTLLVGLVGSNWGPLHRFDTAVARNATAWMVRHPDVVEALDLVAVVFAPRTFYLAAALAAVGLWVRGARRLAAWVAVTAATGSVLGVLMKITVERSRPLIPDPVAHAPGYSFPSGHALNSALGCAILLLAFLPLLHGWRRVAAWVAAIAVTLLTGADRVLLGVHYVSDVVGGWALASATLAGTVAAFSLWRREHGFAPLHPSQGVEPELESELSASVR